MQEVQPGGGEEPQKTFVGLSGAYWAPGCPRAAGGLYFIHGAENKKKYSKQKSPWWQGGGDEEQKDRVKELQHNKK